MAVEPVPDEPAAVATTGDRRALVVADYHAGIETVLQTEGVEINSQADSRRERLLSLLDATDPDRLVVLGDLAHAIGEPWDAERAEITELLGALSVPVTLVKGNHDGEIEGFLSTVDHDVTVTSTGGTRFGTVGFAHGHTWPSRDVLDAEVVCIGHEHPVVRLEDQVGAGRMERAWLRGKLQSAPFCEQSERCFELDGELVVFPAFNDLSGGTWVNVEGQAFLAPFLPDGVADGSVYLLDGTRLGPYDQV